MFVDTDLAVGHVVDFTTSRRLPEQIVQFPQAIGHVSRECWSPFQRTMNSAETVMEDVQRHSGAQVPRLAFSSPCQFLTRPVVGCERERHNGSELESLVHI